MPDVLTYVLHYEGSLNKNSLGAVSEGAARAAEIFRERLPDPGVRRQDEYAVHLKHLVR